MKRVGVLAIILVCLLVLGGCGKKAPTTGEDLSIPVEVTQVAKSDINTSYNTSGQIEASTEVVIAPKVSGRVSTVYVKLGDRVNKGQVLYQIDAKDARNSVSQADAGVGIAQANLARAQQTLKDAQTAYERSKNLFEAGAISKSEFEQATTGLVNARLGLELSQKQLEQAQISLNTARDSLGDYSVTSPISGFVGSINVEVGEMVSPQVSTATVVNIDTVKVKASIPENVVDFVKLGSKVPVQIDSLHKALEGTVSAIAPAADPTTKAYETEVQLNNPDGDLKPGMVAKLNLFTGSFSGVIAVPVDAVIERDGQYYVFIVEKNKAKEMPVKIGISDGKQTEIKEGLKEGEKVVVKGNHLLSEGQPVKVVKGLGGVSQ